MRGRLILVAFVALGLGACGKNAQTDNNQTAGENLTAESIVSNDVTAIDAVTGDAANMAADVDLNYGNLETNGAGPVTSGAPVKPTRPSAPKLQATEQNTAAAAINTATNAQ
jgi:hypothetical protein